MRRGKRWKKVGRETVSNCDLVPGWLFGSPIPTNSCAQLLGVLILRVTAPGQLSWFFITA